MSFPPHLPAPFSNIKEHHKWQRVKILMAATVFGLAAGLSGAAVMLGWIWPGFGGGDNWVISTGTNRWVNNSQMEDRVRAEMNDRTVTIFSDQKNLHGVGYLDEKNKLGEGVVLTSDGWAVMTQRGDTSGYKNWRALFQDRSVFRVEKILTDKIAGLVYLKLANDNKTSNQESAQFKAMSFETDLLKIGDGVFVGDNGQWYGTVIKLIKNQAEQIPHTDFAPVTLYEVGTAVNSGQVLANGQGNMIGLSLNNNFILPVKYISQTLSSILATGKISYPTLGVEGWFSTERPIVVGTESVIGFFVTKGNEVIRAGDVLTEVSGKIVDENNLWYNIVNNKAVHFKVWRAGKSLELTSSVK